MECKQSVGSVMSRSTNNYHVVYHVYRLTIIICVQTNNYHVVYHMCTGWRDPLQSEGVSERIKPHARTRAHNTPVDGRGWCMC
jgi:hypothetical protein